MNKPFKKNTPAIMEATARLLFVALFVLGGGLFTVAPAASAQVEQRYAIQFKDRSGILRLAPFAASLSREFDFSGAPQFQNTYTFTAAESLAALTQKLSDSFVYLRPLAPVTAADVVLNDPGFTSNSQDIDKEWAIAKAGFIKAWNRTTGSNNNIVAVIDTGIDETHSDLRSITFVQGYNVLTHQPILTNVNSDDNGHGTLIAGILGASPSNNLGIVGTNWQISVMPVKALDASGKGDSTSVAEAIVWAADHGANIINLSLSGIGTGHDTALANAIAYAYNKNIVIVAAAGNDVATTGGNLDTNPDYPVCDDNNSNMIIGVAATDVNDQKTAFSDYGKLCIDVSAPGKRILTTINRDPVTKNPAPNSYVYGSGTSLAVPFVAGEAALIRSLYPSATAAQIRDRIIASADPIDYLNSSQCEGGSCQGMLGSGRINAARSVANPIVTPGVADDDLVLVEGKNTLYHIVGGQKRFVSTFVFNQKFQNVQIKTLPEIALSAIPDGPAEAPADGTLVKTAGSPTVFIIMNGQKLPVTLGVFTQRAYSFANVKTVTFQEMALWPLGSFMPPTDGTLLRTPKNQTVYWVVAGVLHPINYRFYMDRGLNIFPVLFVGDADIQGFPKGEAYIR